MVGERYRKRKRAREEIKEVSMAAGREKREHEKEKERERGIVYMFEKGQLTWVKKEREGERKTERWHPKQKRVKWVKVADESERGSEIKRQGWFTCLKSDSERG